MHHLILYHSVGDNKPFFIKKKNWLIKNLKKKDKLKTGVNKKYHKIFKSILVFEILLFVFPKF
jgi:hypothetical protein